MTGHGDFAYADRDHEIHAAARQTVEQLTTLIGAARDSGAFAGLNARLTLAMTALTAATASVGSCAQDGTNLSFVGRADGLYVCCGGSPQHCWKL